MEPWLTPDESNVSPRKADLLKAQVQTAVRQSGDEPGARPGGLAECVHHPSGLEHSLPCPLRC